MNIFWIVSFNEGVTPDLRITNASWLLISFSIHIFYANRDKGTANEVFFPNQVSLVSIKCNEVPKSSVT